MLTTMPPLIIWDFAPMYFISKILIYSHPIYINFPPRTISYGNLGNRLSNFICKSTRDIKSILTVSKLLLMPGYRGLLQRVLGQTLLISLEWVC